jgi:hypothetical protein
VAIKFLSERKLIKLTSYEFENVARNIFLTPDGKVFINGGGITHETKLKNSPLEANRIANQAKVISLIAAILAAIAIVICLYKK